MLYYGRRTSTNNNNKIGTVYCLEHTDISKVVFTPHHVGHWYCNVFIVTILAQQCVPRMFSGHSCANVATRMVKAQGCPGLVSKAGESWPVGQSPWSHKSWGLGLNEASILGKGLDSKTPGVK
jgi:hypothetical protein